jgi:hypothetical protein
MMHSHSPNLVHLAVPGIGFAQNISVGDPRVPDVPALRDCPRATCATRTRKIDDQHDGPRHLIDRIPWLSVRQ